MGKSGRCQSLDDLQRLCRKKSNIHVTHVIANYIFSRYWPDAKVREDRDPDGKIIFTFGIHPHEASSNVTQQLRDLLPLVQRDTCFGVGEVGLDFSRPCNCGHRVGFKCSCFEERRKFQRKALRDQMLIARRVNKTLIIHSRGSSMRDQSAETEIFDMIKELQLQDHRIHRHCFVGTEEELRRWLAFPNCKFGITAKAIEVPTQKAAIRAIPSDRLLLESDSPKLIPKGGDRALNTPWQYGCTLRLLSQYRQVSATTLVKQCNQNARDLYRF